MSRSEVLEAVVTRSQHHQAPARVIETKSKVLEAKVHLKGPQTVTPQKVT